MSPKKSPFKFLDSYQQSDADVFFGREKETEDLYNALSGVKHLMVYGPSGSGKTSLVECGLRNQFSDADWFALTIRKGADINASVFAAINEALHEKIAIDPATKMPEDPQMEFGQAIEQLFVERYQPVYLLFDQFEELLISGGSEEKKKFFTLLNKLIRNKVPCRMMLIMREEFIGHLSEFEPICPSIFQHRFRVEKMGRKNVEEVIYHILEAPRYRTDFKVDDSRKLAESILSKLPDKKKEIELSHVQVFLGELWDRAQTRNEKDELPVLSEDLIQKEDNLEAVLESFLKKQMTDLEKKYGESAPLELLATMITERFTKLQLSEAAIKTDLEHKKVIFRKPIADLLKDLELRRIIRSVKIGDEAQYEISHDVLALVVGQNLTEDMKMREKAGDIYKVYQERQGLFSQDDIDYLRPFQQRLSYPQDLQQRIDQSVAAIKQQQEQEKAKTRKRLRTLYSLLAAALIALIVAVIFYVDSKSATIIAEEAKKSALHLSDSLKVQTEIAERAKNEALKRDSLAQIDRDIAIAALKKAEESDFRAQIDRDKAVMAQKRAEGSDSIAKNERDNAVRALKSAQKSDSTAKNERDNAIIEATKAKAYLLNATAKNLLVQGMKSKALRLAEAAYTTALDVFDDPPILFLSSIKEIYYADYPSQLFKIKHLMVSSVAFSPDGKSFLTGGRDRTAILWDLEGNIIRTFPLNSLGKFSVAFSPDGKYVLIGNQSATLWDLDGNKICSFPAGKITSLAFSPDGKSILTGSTDQTAILWDLDGNKMQTFLGHKKKVNSVSFSPDGKSILTGSDDRNAILWDLAGNQISTFKGHGGPITSVAYSPVGKSILTGSMDNTAIHWDLKGNLLGKRFEGHIADVTSVAFSPDGKSILTGSADETAILWDLEGNKIGKPFQGHTYEIRSVTFSPDGKSILTGGDDTAILWDLEGNKIGNPFLGHSEKIWSVAFSPNGKYVLTGSNDKTAILWDLYGKKIHTFQEHKDIIFSVVFSPDGKFILTGSRDKTAILWSLKGDKIQTFRNNKMVTSVAFSPDGKSFLTGDVNGIITFWDISGKPLSIIKVFNSDVDSIIFSPDGKSILTSSLQSLTVLLLNLELELISTFEGNNMVMSAAFSLDGKSVLVGNQQDILTIEGGTVSLWNLGGTKINTFQGPINEITSLAFSPDRKSIFTSLDYQGTAILWDLEGNKTETFQGHKGAIRSIAFSPDGKSILTGSEDKTAILWRTSLDIYNWLKSPECRITRLTEEEKIKYGITVVDEY